MASEKSVANPLIETKRNSTSGIDDRESRDTNGNSEVQNLRASLGSKQKNPGELQDTDSVVGERVSKPPPALDNSDDKGQGYFQIEKRETSLPSDHDSESNSSTLSDKKISRRTTHKFMKAMSLGQRALTRITGELTGQTAQASMAVPIDESNEKLAPPRIVNRHLPIYERSSVGTKGHNRGVTVQGMSGIVRAGGANQVIRAKAQYRVHAFWLTFIGDSSIEEFEAMYQRHHDLERFLSIKRFVSLLTIIFIAYLVQTYNSHPGQWDYHFFVIFLCCFSLLGLLLLNYKNGRLLIPDDPKMSSRLQSFMAISIFIVCLVHMLRALQNRKDIGYAWTMSYLPCLYISTMATVIGLRFIYFLPTAIAILIFHICIVLWLRVIYRGDKLEIVDRVSRTLWMYDAVTLVIFAYVSRNLEYASRKAFVQLRTLMDVNIDVRVDSDRRMIENMFESSAAKKVLRALGGTDWVIRWQDMVLGEKFAAGGSGQIFKGYYMDQDIAAKEIFTQMIDKDNVQEFCREAGILAQLHHPNIVQFFGVSIHSDNLYLVTEFCKFNLREAIELDEVWEDLDPSAKQKIALGIASGISYLHQRGIAHRDLKPPNVLLTEMLTVKLCDFGLASVAGERRLGAKAQQQTMAIGTPQYMPPEIMQGSRKDSADVEANQNRSVLENEVNREHISKQKFRSTSKGSTTSNLESVPFSYDDLKVDSYAFGIILFSLWTRREPYVGMNAFHVMTAVLLHDIRPEHSHLEFPRKYYELMTLCWARDPSQRPTFVQIKKELSEPNFLYPTRSSSKHSSLEYVIEE